MTDHGGTVLPGRGRIAGFDGIRAVAVGSVIAIHLGHYFLDGVTVFFVLSGFLITGLLMSSRDRSLIRFWTRRLLRLYPALLLYLGGVAVFALVGWATVPAAGFVAAAVYLTNYAPFSLLARETSHLWSLAVEEQFYVLWPLVMLWGRRAAPLLCVAGIAASWWLRTDAPPSDYYYPDRFFLPAADGILVGCLTALLVCGRPDHPVVRGVMRSRLTLAVGLAVIALPIVVTVEWPSAGAWFAYAEAQRAAVALVLLWICGNQRSALVRALDWSPIRYLGTISYGIYLWQGLFVRNGPSDPQVFLHEAPWNVIAAVVVAALSYELVERRFLRLKDRVGPQRQNPRTVTPLSSPSKI